MICFERDLRNLDTNDRLFLFFTSYVPRAVGRLLNYSLRALTTRQFTSKLHPTFAPPHSAESTTASAWTWAMNFACYWMDGRMVRLVCYCFDWHLNRELLTSLFFFFIYPFLIGDLWKIINVPERYQLRSRTFFFSRVCVSLFLCFLFALMKLAVIRQFIF